MVEFDRPGGAAPTGKERMLAQPVRVRVGKPVLYADPRLWGAINPEGGAGESTFRPDFLADLAIVCGTAVCLERLG